MMRRNIAVWILAGLMAVGCADSATQARDLIEQADEKLVRGGLEYPVLRAEMRGLYEEGLRRATRDRESLTAVDLAFVESHAHFGLAMVRIWDLADRVVDILEEGGVLAALRGDDSGGARPAYCTMFENFEALEGLVKLLLRTALLPVIEDLRQAVAADPAFRITILRAGYDLAPFTNERGLTNRLDLAATYGSGDLLFLLGAMELATGGAEASFAYRDLLANLFLFSFVANRPLDGQPAKVFNSNPCTDYPTDGNPLLDPGFGILTAAGPEALARARGLLASGLGNLARALRAAEGQAADAHLVGVASDGRWNTGLLRRDGAPRLQLNLSAGGDTPLNSVLSLVNLANLFFERLSGTVQIGNVAALFDDLRRSLEGGDAWAMRDGLARVIPAGDVGNLVSVLRQSTSALGGLAEYETAFVDLAAFFDRPPGDLKALAPLVYTRDESFSDVNGNGRRDAANIPVQGEADFASTEPYTDINCNGRWDQRGDLIVQSEQEPFVDENRNGVWDPGENQPVANRPPHELGIIGTFLDLEGNAIPSRSDVDGLDLVRPVGTARLCASTAPVTWPASVADPDFGADRLRLTDPTPDAPYGVPVTTGESGEPREDGRALGPVLGHYWPPPDWNFGSWPKDARRDPANGTVDHFYLFFPDPGFGGILIRDLDGQPDSSGTHNAWLNRFLSQWGRVFDEMGL